MHPIFSCRAICMFSNRGPQYNRLFLYVGFGWYLDFKDDRVHVGALVTEFSNLFHSVIVYGKKYFRYVFALHKGTVKFCPVEFYAYI